MTIITVLSIYEGAPTNYSEQHDPKGTHQPFYIRRIVALSRLNMPHYDKTAICLVFPLYNMCGHKLSHRHEGAPTNYSEQHDPKGTHQPSYIGRIVALSRLNMPHYDETNSCLIIDCIICVIIDCIICVDTNCYIFHHTMFLLFTFNLNQI